MNKFQIRNEIEKRVSSYTDEELFSSKHFGEILMGTIESTCAKLGRIPKLHSHYSPESEETSCTDGELIIHNSASPLIRTLGDLWKKYVANVGTIAHETGHILYTDFKNINPLREGWLSNNFSWYPQTPEGGEEIRAYCREHKNFSRIYGQELCFLNNALEDVYEENRLFESFGGLVTAGLTLVADQLYEQSISESEMLSKYLSGDVSLLTVANNLILIRERGYVPKVGEITKEMEKPREQIYEVLNDIDPKLKELHWESDGRKRCRLYNDIAVRVFELMESLKEEDSEKNDNDFNESNNSEDGDFKVGDGTGEKDVSDEKTSEMMKNSEEMHKTNGATSESVGDSKPVDTSDIDKDEVESKKENSKSLSKSKKSMSDYLEKAIKDCATSEVIDGDEKNHAKALEEEAKSFNKDGAVGFKGWNIKRETEVHDKDEYKEILNEVIPTANALVRKISTILKERKTEGMDSGYLLGQKFNAQDVYHGDGKYFSREIVPDGQPNVVFGILLDESGSMWGDKVEKTKKSAILLEYALRKLNIPLIICGHDESVSRDVNIYSYVDFDTNDDKDCYRLAGVQARSNNADGCAITYMAKKLVQRPEEIKVLIVISDGEPAAYSYYYKENLDNDCVEAIKQARKKDIKVFGAIIDEYESVAKLYGDKYSFDCRDEGALQKELIRITKKYILAK